MPTTTNYGWTTPADTDLVKDGASAIRTLGSAIDTTVFNNASAAIAKTIVDAKGDLIAATAADTVARLAVGANNTVLTADSSTSTGLKWATPSSGGLTELASGSLTGATVTLSNIPSGYVNLYLLLRDFYPATNNAYLFFKVNGSSSSIYASVLGANAAVTYGTGGIQITDSSIANADNNNACYINFFDYLSSIRKISTSNALTTVGGSHYNYVTSGYINLTSAITSIEIFYDTGNHSGGTYVLYGVK